MKRFPIIAGLLIFLSSQASAQIIDVHLHSYVSKDYWGRGQQHEGLIAPASVDQHLKQTIEQMDKNNVKYAIVSGTMESVDKYCQADSRFIPGYEVDDTIMPIGEFEQLLKANRIKVFGEIASVYHGRTLTDSLYAPYLTLCEKYEIPVAYHTGGAPPMAPFNGFPNFRLSLGDPYLIEEVLVRYPKLKVYLMHAGESFYQKTVRMMVMYRHLYVDLGVLLWYGNYERTEAVEFLTWAKAANVLDRVMFGSDQMVWPEAITKSHDFLNSLTFLTAQEKRMILYDNAKTFFKLD